MSNLDLRPIKERAEAATRGPWTVGVRWEEPYGTYWLPVNAPSTNEEEPHQPDRVALIRYFPGGFQFPHADAQADAEFIAAARGDVRDLIAEVERLRAALLEEQTVHAITFDNFEAHVEESIESRNALLDERDRLQREVEGLRAWRDGNHDEHRRLRAEVEQWRATFGETAHRRPLNAAAIVAENARLRLEVANLTAAPLCAGCGVVLGPDVRKNRDGDGFYCDGCHTAYQGRVSAYLKGASDG